MTSRKQVAELRIGQHLGSRYRFLPPNLGRRSFGGTTLGKDIGRSREFQEHRTYQPGDDVRDIDWSAFARTDKLVVKLYQDETSPHLDLILDNSGSMGTHASKTEAMFRLAGLLVRAASNGGFTAQAWKLGEQVKPLAGNQQAPEAWQKLDFADKWSPAWQETPAFRAGSLRVLVSDLLWPEDPTAVLQSLGKGSLGVMIVQILAEQELHPASMGNVVLVDSETGLEKQLFVDEICLDHYRKSIKRHLDRWLLCCREQAALWASLPAEAFLADPDLSPFLDQRVLEIC